MKFNNKYVCDAVILCYHVLLLGDNLEEQKEFTLNNNSGEQCLTFDVCEFNNEKFGQKFVCNNLPQDLVGR